MLCSMGDMLKLIWWVVIGLFRSQAPRSRRRSWRCATSSMCCKEKRQNGSPISTGSFLPPSIGEGLASLATIRCQELDGFIDGLFGDKATIGLPERAHRGL